MEIDACFARSVPPQRLRAISKVSANPLRCPFPMPAPQTLTRSSCDALSQHLRAIGRIPLLSQEEEITLGKAVQAVPRVISSS